MLNAGKLISKKLLLALLTGFLLLVLFAVFIIPHQKSSTKETLTHNLKIVKTIDAHDNSPSATTVPTLAPTATPAVKKATKSAQTISPPAGFCLRIPVVFYHHIQPLDEAEKQGNKSLTVQPDILDKQMNYLATSGYTTISAEQLVNSLLTHQALPGKNIVVTLDDGYDDTYKYAYPVFKKYNITANLMIPSGLMNNPGYMSWDHLKEMSGNSLIKVYNHTWSHSSLGSSTKEKIEYELKTSNSQLESNLGHKINIFTYPYGSFSKLAISELQQNGFIAGFSTLPGTLQCESQIMTLHRTRIGNAPLSSYGL